MKNSVAICSTKWPYPACLVSRLLLFLRDHLVGLVVKASASRMADPECDSCLGWDFSRSSYTSDLEIGTSMAKLPGALSCRVGAGTGCPLSVYCDWVR